MHEDIAAVTHTAQENIRTRIAECEKAGRYNDDVQSVNYDKMRPVTPDYRFIPDNPLYVIWTVLIRTLAVILGPAATGLIIGGRIEGRKNLHNIRGGAIAVCNHVHDLDNMLVRQALFGHRLYITVAEFNNMKGIGGAVLRGAGTLPFSHNSAAMVNLYQTISRVLAEKCIVLFYPEQSMWYRYEKPRPFRDGAFHFAVDNSVPVIPMFITFSSPGRIRRIFSKKKIATLHILPPIYPDTHDGRKSCIKSMREAAFGECCECYERVYGKKNRI